MYPKHLSLTSLLGRDLILQVEDLSPNLRVYNLTSLLSLCIFIHIHIYKKKSLVGRLSPSFGMTIFGLKNVKPLIMCTSWVVSGWDIAIKMTLFRKFLGDNHIIFRWFRVGIYIYIANIFQQKNLQPLPLTH